MLRDAVDRSKHELRRLGKLGRRWLTFSFGERPVMVTMLNEVDVGRDSQSSSASYDGAVPCKHLYRARQLYKNISMLFLFPVKDGKLNIGVNATFDASCYG